MKLVEFLYFYLMPETPFPSNNYNDSPENSERLQRSPSKRAAGLGRSITGARGEDGATKTTEEKQGLLGRYLNNVEDLVEDLRESAPFGANLT